MITTLAELDIKEYDQYDVQSSRVLGEFFRCWKPDTTKSSELFMKVVEKCDADIVALILTLCNAPSRVRLVVCLDALDKHECFLFVVNQNV